MKVLRKAVKRQMALSPMYISVETVAKDPRRVGSFEDSWIRMKRRRTAAMGMSLFNHDDVNKRVPKSMI
jgi:hypothetical protein